MSAIKVGTPVRQVQPAPVAGMVVDKKFIAGDDKFQYLVESPGGEGEAPHQKWFSEGEIEATGDAQGE